MSDRQPWTNPRLRAAWARKDWAAIFREYRRVTGLSQRELEPLVGMAQPYISVIERGNKQITSAEVIDRITRGLNVPEELGGVPAREQDLSEWMPPPELRERIAHAHTTGSPDVRTADWISEVLATYRRAEDQVGGRELWSVVRSQLDSVTRSIPDASGATADKLLTLAGEHAHWLSWVAAQEGRMGVALSWLDLAQGWASEAGAYDLSSWVTRVRSHYVLTHNDPLRAMRIAEGARIAPPGRSLSPAAEAIAAHTQGMAAAAAGERDRARQLSDQAYELALRVPDPGERPGWLYWLDPVRAQLQRADMAYAVRDWSDAAALYGASLSDLEGYPRDHAYYSARYDDARSRA
ncbi:helix-turn-helix domain-containing protein [Actinomadura rupiterrae]|uniref:helix-turn-helix domain-containing protein n=1 Tax=Actinomadura rupiterrae TaxID=559627 RepID=UPI0020A407C1|nr:helix-turn-helix transcriptional regulator [Actinomadura rupiterrae]MCP2340590.1 transcriptional regulator with XRE-family HTH domain [Actinomadura rupiterrae]